MVGAEVTATFLVCAFVYMVVDDGGFFSFVNPFDLHSTSWSAHEWRAHAVSLNTSLELL